MLSKGQRQAAGTKALLAVGGLAAAVVLALVGSGLFDELVAAPARPVATIDDVEVSAETYRRYTAFRRFELEGRLEADESVPGLRGGEPSPALVELQSLAFGAATELVNDEFIRREAEIQGFAASAADLEAELNRYFAEAGDTAPPRPGDGSDSTPAEDLSRQLDSLSNRTGLSRSEIEPFLGARIRERWLVNALTADLGSAPAHFLASQILAPTEEARDEVTERLAAGEAFEEVARDASVDFNSRDQGGALGWVPRGLFSKEWDEAALTLPKGEVGAPVQTSEGWYFIRVDERLVSRPLDAGMKERLQAAALRRWLQAAMSEADVQYILNAEIIEWARRRTPGG